MKASLASVSLSAVVFACAGAAQAAPTLVNGLGVGGWASGDTRTTTGAAANPTQINAQIKFVGEGQAVPDAAGANPDATPTGTLNGQGAVRLDGTNTNSGKSDIGLMDASGMAAASALLDRLFTASYRSYSDPNPTLRTVSFGIAVSNGLSNCGAQANLACYFTFAHTDPDINPANPNTWLTETVSATAGDFSLYGSGAPGGGGPKKTLADWALDGTWGFLFDDANNYDVVRMNFNIGSSSRNGLVYVDWVQSNLINNGETFDFVSADVGRLPEPGSLALVGLAVAGLAGAGRLRKR